MKKPLKIPLILQVLLAIALGIGCGFLFPDSLVRVFATFNDFFGQFINFCVPLIIVALVTVAIANTKQNAGKMLLITLALAFVSTVVAGLCSYGVCSWLFPKCITPSETVINAVSDKDFSPYFSLKLPPALDVLTALAIAFILGLGIIAVKAETMKKLAEESRDIIMLTIEN